MVTSVRLLGEVDVLVDGHPVALGTPRQRCIVAVLALEAGQVVAVDRVIERVWGADVTPRTRTTLHGYISRLRAALADAGGAALTRRSGGYVLETDPSTVDLHRCRELRAMAREDGQKALSTLTEALELWRGEPLTGLAGEWAEAERERLERERLATWQDLVDTKLRLELGEDLVGELAARAKAHPLDERTAGHYMLALHQAGRTAEALEHYRRVRSLLIEELGADPGALLQELHQQILTARPALTGTSPRELRAAPTSFVGRGDEMRRLDSATTISVITGAGGLGKTWLALHWAHRRLDRFPDGQLFVDLRGFSPDDKMAPATALSGFLTALGVEAGSIPPDTHARSALFRSLTAGKRLLVVLDNAADTDQVVPLLPGGESCAVVVTSRNRLAGLVARYDARRITLDVLSDDESRGLLAARLGPARVDAERAAVDELVGLCGGLPLALSVIAGRAGAPLSAAAAELRESRLAGLADDDPSASLPTVLSWSYRALTEEQATTFGLLAITPGPDAGLLTAANLTRLSPARTQGVLRGLEQASLLERDSRGRYRMHDLTRAYATDTAQRLPEDVRDAASRQVLDFCAHTAYHAGLLLDAHRGPVGLAPPAPGPHLHSLPDAPAAMAWLDSERATLLAAQRVAAPHTVWWLALSLDTFHQRQGHRHDRLAAWRAAVRAATQLPDLTPRLIALRHLGRACASLGLREEAIEHLHDAIDLAGDHPYERGHAHQTLAWVLHDDPQALDHAVRALHLFVSLDLPLCVAHGHNAVARHAARRGDHDTARGHYHAALTLHRDQHNPAGEATSLDGLGSLEHDAGDHDTAIRHHTQALTLRRGLGNAFESAGTLDRLGPPHVALGRPDEARTVWQEALLLYRKQGRGTDAEHVQRRLDSLTGRPGTDQVGEK